MTAQRAVPGSAVAEPGPPLSADANGRFHLIVTIVRSRLTLVAAMGLLVIAGGVPAGTAPQLTIDVYAHRGGAGLAPENTLAAFRNALALHVDVLELDVHVSRDGEVVVIHDFTLTRTTRTQGYVRETALPDLKRLDAGAWFNPRFAGERIPTLREVLDLIKAAERPQVRLNIETKYPLPGEAPMPPSDFEERVLQQVRAAGLLERIIVQSFFYPSLGRVKTLDPSIRTAVLRASRDPTFDPVSVVREAKADMWAPQAGLVMQDAVEALHRAGIPVVPWTVNAPAEMERLIGLGIGRLRGDGMITDYPDRLIEVLRARGIRP